MIDLQRNFGHHQGAVLEEQVVGLQDAAPLRVFDGDQCEVHRLVGHPVKRVPQRSKGPGRCGGEGTVERLFGVSAGFPLVADRELAGDPATLSKFSPRLYT